MALRVDSSSRRFRKEMGTENSFRIDIAAWVSNIESRPSSRKVASPGTSLKSSPDASSNRFLRSEARRSRRERSLVAGDWLPTVPVLVGSTKFYPLLRWPKALTSRICAQMGRTVEK